MAAIGPLSYDSLDLSFLMVNVCVMLGIRLTTWSRCIPTGLSISSRAFCTGTVPPKKNRCVVPASNSGARSVQLISTSTTAPTATPGSGARTICRSL